MPKGIPKSGKRKSGHRVARVTFSCQVCGCQRKFTPSQAALRTGRFCSRKCAGIAVRKPKVKATVTRVVMAVGRWRDPQHVAAYMKVYHAARHSQRRVYQRRYREKHHKERMEAQRIRRSRGTITSDFLRRLFTRSNGYCVYCGKRTGLMEVDHVVAVANGGRNHQNNLVPSCRQCNASKGAKEPAEWISGKHGIDGLARALLFLEGRDRAALRAGLYIQAGYLTGDT